MSSGELARLLQREQRIVADSTLSVTLGSWEVRCTQLHQIERGPANTLKCIHDTRLDYILYLQDVVRHHRQTLAEFGEINAVTGVAGLDM